LDKKTPDRAIVNTGGIGYEVFITLNTFYKLPDAGEDIFFLVYTHVREDTLQLFGFLDENEKRLFHLLLGVAKIGPRLALNILSGITAGELKEAIMRGDQYRINQIPRVGKKTAERIIVELKDKVKDVPVGPVESLIPDVSRGKEIDDVLEALLVLGYSKKEAEKGLSKALAESGDQSTVEKLLKESLRILTKA
jgi:Holliday junction DNA helicase RuvA